MIEVKNDRIKIKELIIPEPNTEKNHFPDPRKLFMPVDWEELEFRTKTFMKIVTDKNSEWWPEIDPNFLLNVGLLNPEIIRRQMDSKIWNDLESGAFSPTDAVGISKALATISIINKDKFKEGIVFTNNRWGDLLTDFVRNRKDPAVTIPTIGFMRIADPISADELAIDPQDQPDFDQYVRIWKQTENWEKIAETATNIKLAFPSRMDEMGLDKREWRSVWNYLLNKFEKHKVNGPHEDPEEFLDVASRMAVLAAKEIKVTNAGVQMTYEDAKQFSVGKSQIPEWRRF